jgi:plastocyanin
MKRKFFRLLSLLGLGGVAGVVTMFLGQTAYTSGQSDNVVRFPNFDYLPYTITVTRGSSVTWEGNFAFHPLQQVTGITSLVPMTGGFESSFGNVFTKQFTQTGEFYYICITHADETVTSMRGIVRVVDEPCLSWDVPFGREPTATGTFTPTGRVRVTLNTTTNEVGYFITYTNLSSAETNAHFHSLTAPALTGPPIPGQPLVAGSSPKTGVWKITDAVKEKFLAGDVYVNIHTSNNTGGEIRADLKNPVACVLDQRIMLPMVKR